MVKNITLFLTFITLSATNLLSVKCNDYPVTDFVMKSLSKSVDASLFGYIFSCTDWKAKTTAQGFTGQEKTTLHASRGGQVNFTIHPSQKNKDIVIQTYFPKFFTIYNLRFSILSPLLKDATAAKADIPMSMDPKTTCWIKDYYGRFNGVACETTLKFEEFQKIINEKN